MAAVCHRRRARVRGRASGAAPGAPRSATVLPPMRRNRPIRRPTGPWAAGVVLFALVAAGCSDDSGPLPGPTTTTTPPATAAPTTTADPGPAVGGTLTMAVFAVPPGLDPIVAAGGGTTGGSEMAAIYDTLVRWDPTTSTYQP